MTTTESLTEKNRAIVEKLYAAASSGDLGAIAPLLADDIVVDEPSYLPYGKLYRGKEEFAGLLGMIGQFLDLTKVQVNYTIADGDRVAACLGIPDVTTGEMTHFIEQSTLRDGQIVEMKLFYYDAQSMIGKPKIV
ncbi:MAG TPA: nuclear transport factor 2 family protein [Pseudonocardia sp.]|jgi:ketosteroid isomerase-like protein|nr:nuclear transport factor 2 family protein [Pseudonocardia sp.]